MDLTMTKIAISGEIDSELKVQLDELSTASNQSNEALVEQAVAEYIARQKQKILAIEGAIQEADQGIFVSDAAVSEWLDSWGHDDEKPAPQADIFLK